MSDHDHDHDHDHGHQHNHAGHGRDPGGRVCDVARFDDGNPLAERGTRAVLWITLATMVLEIGAGWWFNSMALLADGWHMGSHALAIGLASVAYAAARRLARDRRFAFGPWKIEVLAGFASAVALLGVAGLMVAGSVERLIDPQPIRYREAIAVAVLGLVVNLMCALILHRAGGHGHGHGHADHHDHGHAHHHHHEDLNLKAAYLHVVTDAATSVLAIVALLGGWLAGWAWLDPAMGIAGAVLVALWARGLIGQTATVLLDREMDHPVVERLRGSLAAAGHRVVDLHVWRVGRSAYACTLTLEPAHADVTADDVRRAMHGFAEIAHTTIELRPAAG